MNANQAPVSVGEEHKVTIDSVGNKGDGVARVKGFILFIKGVKKGDYVQVKITKVMEKVGFADVTAKLEKPNAPREIPAYKAPEPEPEDTSEFEELNYSEEF